MKIDSGTPASTTPSSRENLPRAGGVPLKKLLNIDDENKTTCQPLSARTVTSVQSTSLFYEPLKIMELRKEICDAMTNQDFEVISTQINTLNDVQEKDRLTELLEEHKKRMQNY